jgi:CDP-diacylglycerol--glycerol-3-phosphate 3-phosphatidyltransferase
MKLRSDIGVPTLLTLTRLVFSSAAFPFLLVYFLPYNSFIANSLMAAIFLLLGLTDFFDGYLARRLQQETVLGRLLDPIADKFLLYATLIALLTVGKIYFFWVIIFIGREFFIMGLRLAGWEYNIHVRVSWWGKVKTCMQMAYLFCAILNPYHGLSLDQALLWNGVEYIFLSSALLLTVLSAMQYYHYFVVQLRRL